MVVLLSGMPVSCPWLSWVLVIEWKRSYCKLDSFEVSKMLIKVVCYKIVH